MPHRRSLRYHPLRQPDGPLSAAGRPTAGRRGPDDDRRRDRDRGGAGAVVRRPIRPHERAGTRFRRSAGCGAIGRASASVRATRVRRSTGSIPNLMTMLGLCAGLTSMRFGLEGRFGAAAVAITVAAAIDGLDGRLARLLKATSRFGAEFDSLSDFLCFGVAPSFLLYLWSLQRGGAYGYAPCLMFAVCMALRLARFNASLDGAPKPAYAYNFFTGVPAPAGAGLALFPLFLGLEAKSLGPGPGCWPSARYPLFCARRADRDRDAAGLAPCRSGASRTSRSRPSMCCRCCWAPASMPRCWWPIRGRRWRGPG